jgi:hypothetical protein
MKGWDDQFPPSALRTVGAVSRQNRPISPNIDGPFLLSVRRSVEQLLPVPRPKQLRSNEIRLWLVLLREEKIRFPK